MLLHILFDTLSTARHLILRVLRDVLETGGWLALFDHVSLIAGCADVWHVDVVYVLFVLCLCLDWLHMESGVCDNLSAYVSKC